MIRIHYEIGRLLGLFNTKHQQDFPHANDYRACGDLVFLSRDGRSVGEWRCPRYPWGNIVRIENLSQEPPQ